MANNILSTVGYDHHYKPQPSLLPYCTQACLRRLSPDYPLDERCPNFSLHQKWSKNACHPISKKRLCELVKDQLGHDLDKDCECFDRKGIIGAIGALFKITLTGYGYTSVAKGVQADNEDKLDGEARVYSVLSKLQGVTVPVHLGNIKLTHPYHLITCVRVTSMMLMSWAGTRIFEDMLDQKEIRTKANHSVNQLKSAGVVHDDVRAENLVWNEENNCVMVIDFDRVFFVEPTVSSLGKRLSEQTDTSFKSPSKRATQARRMLHELVDMGLPVRLAQNSKFGLDLQTKRCGRAAERPNPSQTTASKLELLRIGRPCPRPHKTTLSILVLEKS